MIWWFGYLSKELTLLVVNSELVFIDGLLSFYVFLIVIFDLNNISISTWVTHVILKRSHSEVHYKTNQHQEW
jgi:hypothetical protein